MKSTFIITLLRKGDLKMASRLMVSRSAQTWTGFLSRLAFTHHVTASSFCHNCSYNSAKFASNLSVMPSGMNRNKRNCHQITQPSVVHINSFHSDSSHRQGNDNNENHDKPSGDRQTVSTATDEYSEEDGKQLLEEQKRTFQTLLDDAQSQNTVAEDFDFSDVPQRKAEKMTGSKMKVDPTRTSILLFPGQGAQFVGMGEQLLKYPMVNDMFEVASEILGYDLRALCLNGPKEDLDRTVHCQPAVLVTSLAGIEKLKNENPQAIENCVATAGFSVGEYAALVFGGVLSFEDAVYLIKVRAEAMQRASDAVPSGMISVIGGRATNYKEICAEAVTHCTVNLNMEKPVCKVANYLFSNARVLAGHDEALKHIVEMKKHFNLRNIKRLPVSGAFHTPLMAPAEEAIGNALKNVELEEPLIGIHSNVDSKKYMHTKHIRRQLQKQVVGPVMWEQTLGEIYQRKKDDSYPQTFEVGPGNQLGSILKRYNMKAFGSYFKVDV